MPAAGTLLKKSDQVGAHPFFLTLARNISKEGSVERAIELLGLGRDAIKLVLKGVLNQCP